MRAYSVLSMTECVVGSIWSESCISICTSTWVIRRCQSQPTCLSIALQGFQNMVSPVPSYLYMSIHRDLENQNTTLSKWQKDISWMMAKFYWNVIWLCDRINDDWTPNRKIKFDRIETKWACHWRYKHHSLQVRLYRIQSARSASKKKKYVRKACTITIIA